MALNHAEGTRGPQVENAKISNKNDAPKAWELEYEHVHDKPMALNRADGTRGPQVENAKIDEKRCPHGMGIRI